MGLIDSLRCHGRIAQRVGPGRSGRACVPILRASAWSSGKIQVQVLGRRVRVVRAYVRVLCSPTKVYIVHGFYEDVHVFDSICPG